MKKNQEKGIYLVIILLIVIIFILIIGLSFLFYRYEKLENKYEHGLEYKYIFDDSEVGEIEDNFDKKTTKTTYKPTITVKYITQDKALQVALEDMQLSTSDVYDIEVEFENKTTHGNHVYEVTFDYQNYEYEYFIDAKTGKVIASFKSRD